MVKITTKIITKRLDVKDERVNPYEEVEFDSTNSGATLQRTLTHLKYVEDQADFHKREIEDVVVVIGNHKLHVKSSRELTLIIDSLHAYAWALANDI